MDTEYQLDVDVQKMCRLCLTVDERNLKNIFCSDILDGNIVAFPKIYENVTEIVAKKDDKLPQGICVGCKAKICEFHLFKQKCINSNVLLCKILDVPITSKLKQPLRVEQATQSITCEMVNRNTQTTEEEESTKITELFDYLDRKSDDRPTKNVTDLVLKHEAEQDLSEIVEQESSVGADDYVLDYECSEYLSPDNMYVIGENCSTIEDADDPFAEKIEYKVETVDDCQMEELEVLDVTETYNIIEPRKPTTSKRSKKTTEICNICKVDLKSNDVKSHRNLHQQTLPMILDSIAYFRCGRCKTVFSEISHMESHFINGACCADVDEPSCTDYQYLEDFPECETEEGGSFSSCRTLRLASVMQTNDDSFSCELCYNFNSSQIHDILDHCANTHFDNDDETNVVYYDEVMAGPHRCGVCQLNQPSLSAALRHVYFHLTSFICPVRDCGDTFPEFKLLSMHIEQSHMAKENVKHQRCMHCGEISTSYQAFRQHQRKECEKKIFRCDVCEKKFFHKSSLSMHMKYHLAARFACEVCNKTFSQLCDYKVHYRIHSGEKPYKCEFCDKSFRSISNRKDHMSTHRTDKLFSCEICNQTFKSERTLRGHYPIHNPTKKFQCGQCDKSFHRRFHLTLHLKSHDKKDFRIISSITIPSKS